MLVILQKYILFKASLCSYSLKITKNDALLKMIG